jgi:hypothetical protein
MKYKITRTSIFGEKKPCKEAKEVSVITFTDSTASKLKDALVHSWVRRGNAVQKKGFVRVYSNVKKPIWIVDIPNQEALAEFVEKYGDIVITHSDTDEFPYEIEIYDDYRE